MNNAQQFQETSALARLLSALQFWRRSSGPGYYVKETPVIPLRSISDRALGGVIAIMCFLAALTAGSVSQIKLATTSWQASVAAEATIQIRPREGRDLNTDARRALEIAERTPGVLAVRLLDTGELNGLLEPWLGEDIALGELPVPAMIALKINQENAPNFDVLGQELRASIEGVSLDTHVNWQNQLGDLAALILSTAYFVLATVALATVLLIMIATRSAMATNRHVVSTLSLVGAEDRFIANEFQRHFLSIGFKAASLGTLAAVIFQFFLLVVGQLEPLAPLAGGAGSSLPTIYALAASLGWMALVAVFAVILIIVTARITVYRALAHGR